MIVGSNVMDYFDRRHGFITKLYVGFGIITGRKIDFNGTFMI